VSLAAPPLELPPPPASASPPPLTDQERHRLRRAARCSALGFALVLPTVGWLSVAVVETPSRRRVAAFAAAELLAAALTLYWTGALRFVLRRCFAFTAAHRQLCWGAWLSALSAAPTIAETLARGRPKAAIHVAGALVMAVAMGLLLDAGLVLSELRADLFGLRRWFVGSWLWLTGALGVLALLDGLLSMAPTPASGSHLEMLVGRAFTILLAVSGLAVIPSMVTSVLIFARAARWAPADPALPPG
jgi:TM2 domain-containing membrane protein YozV